MRIKYVKPNELKGFFGMNPEASKHFHLHNYPKDTIEIDSRLGKEKRQEVIRHELIENALMRKGLNYSKADRIASKYEKRRR